MEIATLFGLVLGIGALIGSMLIEHNNVTALINLSAIVLVVGGTLGATAAGVSLRQLRKLPKLLLLTFRPPVLPAEEIVEQVRELAERARRDGLLALDDSLDELSDPFLKMGMQMVVDGTDPGLIRDVMESELQSIAERHENGAAMFEAAGGYAPTMGIMGTVVGLISVLGNISDVTRLAPSVATAFVATLWGVATANFLWLPLATKLRNFHSEEAAVREMEIEAVLSIQAGDNPRVIEQKLLTFLSSEQRARYLQLQEKSRPLPEEPLQQERRGSA